MENIHKILNVLLNVLKETNIINVNIFVTKEIFYKSSKEITAKGIRKKKKDNKLSEQQCIAQSKYCSSPTKKLLKPSIEYQVANVELRMNEASI